jgi:hypothetical protein
VLVLYIRDKNCKDHLRSRARWEDSIKMDLNEMKFDIADLIHVALDENQSME